MSIYSQAMGVSTDLLREETRVLGEAGSKEIKSKEFVLDKTIEYNKAATEAATKYGNWKNTLGTIASIAAVASGVGAPMAALIAGGGTLAGGAIGKHQAKQELKGRDGKWMQSQEEDLLKGCCRGGSLCAQEKKARLPQESGFLRSMCKYGAERLTA